MDISLGIVIILVLSPASFIFTYFLAKLTINKCKARIAKAVKEACQESSPYHDRQILFEDYPVWKYLLTYILWPGFICSFAILTIFTAPDGNSVDGAFQISLFLIIVLEVGLQILTNYAQRIYDTSLIIVSEEGIDRRKFNDLGQRSMLFLHWNEVKRVTITNASILAGRVTIKGERDKIHLSIDWTNFEYLAEKMLRLTHSVQIDRIAKNKLEESAKWTQEASHSPTYSFADFTEVSRYVSPADKRYFMFYLAMDSFLGILQQVGSLTKTKFLDDLLPYVFLMSLAVAIEGVWILWAIMKSKKQVLSI
jgi:hypothetical protein